MRISKAGAGWTLETKNCMHASFESQIRDLRIDGRHLTFAYWYAPLALGDLQPRPDGRHDERHLRGRAQCPQMGRSSELAVASQDCKPAAVGTGTRR
jgi:hypothetical protein